MKRPPKRQAEREEIVSLTKAMPHDAGAQMTVLQCCLDNPELLDKEICEELFYPPHGADAIILKAMLAMKKESIPVEYISLIGYLNDHGMMASAGGNGRVSELLSRGSGSNTLFVYYMDRLREKHVERTVILGGVAMIESAYSHDPSTIATSAIKSLTEISEAVRGKKERGMDEQLEEWMESWHEIREGKRESTMPTRWPCWNRKLMGIMPGYTVISGPRGSGKSTLGQNIMTDGCMKKGKAGLFISYEMPVRMVINRMISDLAGIPGAHLFCPDITKPDKTIERRISQCLLKIKESKLKIIHDVRMSLEDVANSARSIKSLHGSCMVMVDYIQISPPPKLGRDFNREQEVAHNSSILRALSKELDDVVIGLSQLNRDGTTRESSSIESDADDVYRVERYKQQDGSTSDDGVLVYKKRSGPEGFNLPLSFYGDCYRFIDKEAPVRQMPIEVDEEEDDIP